MKYLITGAAGFIGFHLSLNLLRNKKNIVYGLDKDYDSIDSNECHDECCDPIYQSAIKRMLSYSFITLPKDIINIITDGQTLLFKAITGNDVDCVKVLLKYGANPALKVPVPFEGTLNALEFVNYIIDVEEVEEDEDTYKDIQKLLENY